VSAAGPATPAVRGLLLVLAAGLLVVLAATASAGVSPRAAGPVALENHRPGTRGWLGPLATGRAIEVYSSASDAVPGDSVDVHVSATPSAHYRVLVYRLGWYAGVGARRVACLPACKTGELAVSEPVSPPDSSGYVSPDWPSTDRFTVGADWVSGYYQVRALLLDGPEAGRSATTYLVVRQPRSSSAMLVQVPVNTWQAYNGWGGKSLYPFSSADGRQAIQVSFDRPFDWSLPGAQGPLGWELPLVRFLERTGYDVSYQSDVYTSLHPRSLSRHKLVVVAGHDEYWTHEMRNAFDAARDGGVNLAFMGANDAYWQIRYRDRGRSIVAYKGMNDPNPDTSLKTAMFRELIPPMLECALIGVQHQGVGLKWPPGDYTVAPTAIGSPWLHGTGLAPGGVVRGIVSTESDSIPGDQSAASSCGDKLLVLFHREHGGDKDGNADSTVYTTPGGARVFASGSHQFSWALDDFAADPDEGHGLADRRVQRFMRNAFDDLTR
jgi:hypothetical protein